LYLLMRELLKTLILLISIVISVILSNEPERLKIRKGFGYVRKTNNTK